MTMSDHIVRVLSKEAGVRGLACITSDLTRDGQRRHETSPLATAALGHGLTAAALLGALLKVKQRVALKAEGNGPLKKLLAESDSYGRVRGYVAVPDAPSPADIGPGEVSDGIGLPGLLTVVKDLGLKDLYHGVIELEGNPLDVELIRYLNISEQVPSVVEIGVGMDDFGELLAAGGLLLDVLPGRDLAALQELAERLEDLPTFDVLLADGHTPDDILARVFGPLPYEVLERRPLAFSCSCSRDRSLVALKALEPADLEILLAEGEAVVDCHFCRERYVFDRTDLAQLLADMEADE